jgi:hypothetical protein
MQYNYEWLNDAEEWTGKNVVVRSEGYMFLQMLPIVKIVQRQ